MKPFDGLPLQPADPALFHARGDANDVRLGERVARDPAAYAACRFVVLGCPQDEGVRRNRGRAGAAQAPAEIRRALYRLGAGGLEDVALFDAGDTMVQPTLEETHAAQQQVVARLLADGKSVIALGGGNDISYPDCGALCRAQPGTLALNVDAHFDVRADTPRNSGTPYRQLLEEGLLEAGRFHEIGGRGFANSPVYARYLAEKGAHVLDLDTLRRKGVARALRRILREARAAPAVFWGFDLDVVRAADAPGVSAPNPLGMTAEEFCEAAAIAGAEPRTRVVEYTEVNPAFDVDGRTSRLAAVALWHFLAAAAGGRR